MGISLSVRPVNQQRRQLTVRFYSKWYCATSGIDVLARRFRLSLNSSIICESVNIKVCSYQVMISNGLFEETNEQRIFLKYFTINPYNALFGFKFLKNCQQFHCTGLLHSSKLVHVDAKNVTLFTQKLV